MIKKLLFLSFFLIFTFSASADEVYQIYINDFSGGQNSYDISHVINPNQGAVVRNALISRKGRLSTRKGVSLFATDESDTAWNGIGRFTPTSTNDYLIVASGGIVCRSTSTASWVTVNHASPLTVTNTVEFVQCNDWLVVLNGVDYPMWYNGVSYYKGIDNPASPPITKYGVWFKNYLFLANGVTENDWVWFSNNLEPTVWTPTDVFRVNTGDGQAVQALKPFKLNELIIYKERSIWVLDISGATPLDDWELQPIVEDIGLIAPRTVVMVGNDQWFLSSEPIGVRSLVRTDLDKIKTSLISGPIQDIFDGTGDTVINRTGINEAAAVFFDNKYLLAVRSGTSTFNDLVLVYDLISNGWFQITGWFVEDWIVFDNKLYFIDSTDGRVLRAFYGNNDIASGPMVTPVDETGDIIASAPEVRGVGYYYESKSYNFDSPELYKLPDALEITCESTGDYNLSVYINLDGGDWQDIGDMSLAGESTNLPEILPFNLSGETLARHTFDLQQYGEFREIQVGFSHSASDESVELRSYSIFGRKRPWRRN